MQCAGRRLKEGKRCHVRVRGGMGGGLVGVFPPSVCVLLPLEGWTVNASCARAADGVVLLSGVRLALSLLYHSHCTLYQPL